MSAEQTKTTISRYFDLMGQGADFSECCAPDVTWLVADTGEVIEGRERVRDYIVALHSSMVDARTRTLVVADDNVFLEGDCAALVVGARTRYCVAYDISGELITAMRGYGIDL
ncbi:nuclear transport factor 2 family protein [Microbacterium sp. B2969]|uniref:Nuclear transport factor 2 family protein n=1 Tax=Microbacterium alkaliflavum TaxID=3248839 RepID=A0ABW7Q6Y1_9MICO